MKRTLFHGTTKEAWENIRLNGFQESDYIDESEQNNPDVLYEYEQRCITRAFENAQLTAAQSGVFSTDLYVIKVEVDNEMYQVLADTSCPNMDCAVCMENEDLNGLDIEVYICRNGYHPSLRLFILEIVWTGEYINPEKLLLCEIEVIQDLIRQNEYYVMDSISSLVQEFDYVGQFKLPE